MPPSPDEPDEPTNRLGSAADEPDEPDEPVSALPPPPPSLSTQRRPSSPPSPSPPPAPTPSPSPSVRTAPRRARATRAWARAAKSSGSAERGDRRRLNIARDAKTVDACKEIPEKATHANVARETRVGATVTRMMLAALSHASQRSAACSACRALITCLQSYAQSGRHQDAIRTPSVAIRGTHHLYAIGDHQRPYLCHQCCQSQSSIHQHSSHLPFTELFPHLQLHSTARCERSLRT